MRYFRLKTDEKKITIYPLVCWHVGAPQADYEFIHEMIERVQEDPHARAIYLGDGGECVTRSSKGMIYEQTMAPQEQLNWLVNEMQPIKDKLIFGVKGNHGYRTFKDSGLGFDESLCMALQIPYFGTSAFWNLQFKRVTYDIFTHHGLDSGVAIGTKINKAKKFEDVIIADAILSAHSHICVAIPPVYRAYLRAGGTGDAGRIRWHTTHGYICGCAYDSRSGYAEDKGYPPILPAHIAITFHEDRDKHEKRQTYETFSVEANKARQPNAGDITSRMLSGAGQCSEHRDYHGQRKPVSCETCWRIYLAKHP